MYNAYTCWLSLIYILQKQCVFGLCGVTFQRNLNGLTYISKCWVGALDQMVGNGVYCLTDACIGKFLHECDCI